MKADVYLALQFGPEVLSIDRLRWRTKFQRYGLSWEDDVPNWRTLLTLMKANGTIEPSSNAIFTPSRQPERNLSTLIRRPRIHRSHRYRHRRCFLTLRAPDCLSPSHAHLLETFMLTRLGVPRPDEHPPLLQRPNAPLRPTPTRDPRRRHGILRLPYMARDLPF